MMTKDRILMWVVIIIFIIMPIHLVYSSTTFEMPNIPEVVDESDFESCISKLKNFSKKIQEKSTFIVIEDSMSILDYDESTGYIWAKYSAIFDNKKHRYTVKCKRNEPIDVSETIAHGWSERTDYGKELMKNYE